MLFKPSPNFTGGRTAKIDRIVIHWIVGTLASADATFANRNSQVSAHYGIENSTVHQYVRESDTAWHAKSANARSIGIEHSAAPLRNATATTIKTSAKLVADICKRYNIPIDRKHIIKHSEVVATACPGTIPIDEIIKQAKELNMVTRDVMAVITRAFNGRDLVAADLRLEGKITATAYLKRSIGQTTAKTALVKARKPNDFTAFLMKRYRNSQTAYIRALKTPTLVEVVKEVPVEVIKEVPIEVEVIKEVVKSDDDRSIGDLLSAVWAKLFKIK